MKKFLCGVIASSLLLAGGMLPFTEAVNADTEPEKPLIVGYLKIVGVENLPKTVRSRLKKNPNNRAKKVEAEADPEPEIVEEEAEVTPETELTEDEIALIAKITMAEAESESELGKRYVIDTILNRVDHDKFPDTVSKVIYQPGQFHPVGNGRFDRCYAKDDICQLVREECVERQSYDCLYFQRGIECPWGVWLFKEDHHNFFGYKG